MRFNTGFMELALEQAKLAALKGEIPIGAVIVDSVTNQVIGVAHNLVESSNNPLNHAEMLIIKQACELKSNKFIIDCDLYVTLEPCGMCAQAISFAKIRRLYYGAPSPKFGGIENGNKVFTSPTCFHTPEIYSGILENESGDLLKEFFKSLR